MVVNYIYKQGRLLRNHLRIQSITLFHISPASCQQIKLFPNNAKEEQCPFEIIHWQQILGRCINLLYQVALLHCPPSLPFADIL